MNPAEVSEQLDVAHGNAVVCSPVSSVVLLTTLAFWRWLKCKAEQD
jgi:hypothetical protein